MYSFIVLGLIPGTDIQITFEIWLQFMSALLAALAYSGAGLRLFKRVCTGTVPAQAQ